MRVSKRYIMKWNSRILFFFRKPKAYSDRKWFDNQLNGIPFTSLQKSEVEDWENLYNNLKEGELREIKVKIEL